MREVHASRFMDMVAGALLANSPATPTVKEIRDKINEAVKSEARFRDIIDSNMPTFYVVDLHTVSQDVADAFSDGLDDYFASTEQDNFSGGFTKLLKQRADFNVGLYEQAGFFSARDDKNNITQEKSAKVARENIYKQLLAYLKTQLMGKGGSAEGIKKIPPKPFLEVYDKLNEAYGSMIADLAGYAESKRAYPTYQKRVAKFSSEMTQIMRGVDVFVADDAHKFIHLSENQYVVVARTFNRAKDQVNLVLGTAVKSFLEGLIQEGFTLKKYSQTKGKVEGFAIGNITNAGHTAAEADSVLVGVNMPSLQEAMFRINDSSQNRDLETSVANLYKNNPLNVDYTLKFQQNFTQGARNLLNMQFSFVISMPASFNTKALNTAERAEIRKYIDKELVPSLEKQLEAKTIKALTADGKVVNITSSPSIEDFVTSALINIIKGVPIKTLKKLSKYTGKDNKSLKIPIRVKNPSLTLTGKTRSPKGSLKVPVPAARGLNGRFVSLVNLQTLINRSLHDRLKANMGQGENPKLLNYRTGRFAASATVTRMSIGRQGTISAFYSYMKNPYATFAAGGQQQYPLSRDPKFIISRSIREIAEPMVANRLRAVLV